MPDIRRADLSVLPRLARLLGRAFADDPMFQWPFGRERTESRGEAYFCELDERLIREGWVWEAGDGAGVAAWIPAHGAEAMFDIDRAIRPLIVRHTDDGGSRYDTMWRWIEEALPPQPFWYLDHIAVDPALRGRGVGTALIEHGLAFAGRDGVAAVLETGRPGNVG